MKTRCLLLSTLLISCTGKSESCDTADFCDTDSNPVEPAEPVVPNEGNWNFQEPQFSEDGCGIGDSSDDPENGSDTDSENPEDTDSGDVVQLNATTDGYELVIDEQDQAMSFPCTVDVNVLNCSDFEREIELDETVTLTQTIGIGGTFASETELNGTIALSVGCSGDGCEEYTAAEEVVVPCDSIGTFIGTHVQ